ncbi:MAG: RNB domain-containing ribonuclease [SAR324 cluster bacterium]|nr:RNB domain-containing ribonuclease [SAR324 cluster bacterium]
MASINMESDILLHHYCFFYKDGNLTAGWIEAIQKNKLLISPLQGKTILLPVHRIGFSWKNTILETEKNAAHQKLQPQLDQAHILAKTHDLAIIHELTDSGKTYTFSELALDFLDSPEDLLQQLGLFIALEKDRRFFKKKNNTYTARTSEELEQAEQQEKRELEKELWEKKAKQWIMDIENGAWNAETPIDSEQQQWIDHIKSVLIYKQNSGYWKNIAPLFNLNAAANEEDDIKLRKLLSRAGYPISWGRLLLLRASVQYEFPQEIQDAARKLIEQPISQSNRKNWFDYPTYTIDSETTADYDDAFSIIEWDARKVVVAIHIADLSDVIMPGMPLFEEAEKRISSVYTLKTIFPMFPQLLSNEYFSLEAKKDRPAMSFVFELSTDKGASFQGIESSLIHVQENLTYEQSNQYIEMKNAFWESLSNCCQTLRKQRLANGALDFERKEVDIDISHPDQINIQPINRNTSSHQIIEELAILVNQEVGMFFKVHQCPGIYRTQAPYEIIEEAKEKDKLSSQNVRVEAARLSTVPDIHAGLGCECYMQMTSPIRRFTDLVTQYQLAQYLRNQKIIFEEEQLMSWAEQIKNTQSGYGRAEQELEKHWKVKYLFQHQGEPIFATIKRHLRAEKTEIVFDDIQYMARVPGLTVYQEGETIQVRIDHVNVRLHQIAVSVYHNSNNSSVSGGL